MRHIIPLVLVLTALWLAISGVYKPPLLVLGALSVALVAWLGLRMKVVGIEHNPVLFSWRLPLYWAWLVWQIALANLHVARRVLSPGSIRPVVLHVPVPQETPVGRVTYANSVTLTPGTVSLELTPDRLTVHALDAHSAAGLRDGVLARRINWLEGSSRGGKTQ